VAEFETREKTSWCGVPCLCCYCCYEDTCQCCLQADEERVTFGEQARPEELRQIYTQKQWTGLRNKIKGIHAGQGREEERNRTERGERGRRGKQRDRKQMQRQLFLLC
jgi:hypothetical protein